MPKNPFEHKPADLKSDDSRFLEKHAGAKKEELEELNIAAKPDMMKPDRDHFDPEEPILEFASEEEKQEYLDQIITREGVDIRRKDLICLENIFDKINPQLRDPFRDFPDFFTHITSTSQRIVIAEGRIIQLMLVGLNIQSLDDVSLPEDLQVLDLSYTLMSSLDKIIFPKTLRTLKLASTKVSDIEISNLPPRLSFLQFYNTPLGKNKETLQKIKEKIGSAHMFY